MDLRKNAESSATRAEERAHQLEEKLNNISESINREKGRLQNDLVQMRSESKLSVSRISADVSTSDLLFIKKLFYGDFIIITLLHLFLISKKKLLHLFLQLEKMECRAKNAEKESALLKEQLEELKKRLDAVTVSLISSL